MEGKTPEWVPYKIRGQYNFLEKSSLELHDIKCTNAVFVDAWLKGETLYVRIQRFTLVEDIVIGTIPGIYSVWIEKGNLKYRIREFDAREKVIYSGGGFLGGMLLMVILMLVL
jgi:hypothetical protein